MPCISPRQSLCWPRPWLQTLGLPTGPAAKATGPVWVQVVQGHSGRCWKVCALKTGSRQWQRRKTADLGEENSQILRNQPPSPAYSNPKANTEGGRATDWRQVHTLKCLDTCWCQANREPHGQNENTSPTQVPIVNLLRDGAP